MTGTGWEESLEIAVARTGHARYRYLCSAANPDPESRAAYRRLVATLAAGESPSPEDLALRAYVARRGGCCG